MRTARAQTAARRENAAGTWPVLLALHCLLAVALCRQGHSRDAPGMLPGKLTHGKFDPYEEEEPPRTDLDLVDLENYFLDEAEPCVYRSERAIDGQSSMETSSRKSSQKSISSNLPKPSVKSSEEVREKGHKFKNVTIGDGICQSIDIRNNVEYLTILKGCRVIEGFLQIVLMEKNIETDFENATFPELREITGYLLIYRVNGLKSLSTLLPNLEVIRGDVLLTDYAFMVYEMQNLHEIDLKKLRKISRGGVRIEKNPNLCYTNTLDWDAIVVAGDKYIEDNKNMLTTCPSCSQCPGGRCWSAQYCQDTGPTNCHSQCLGECRGPTDSDCYVCKHYRHEGRCMERCPTELFAYLSRRCISKEECLRMNHLRIPLRYDDEQKWRPFNGSCLTQCPDGFEDDVDENNMTMCRVCEGRCRKIGQGAIIRHISDAQTFRGTTVIKGALEFQIRNGNPNIVNELTDAFGLIEEITDYLKITHSFPITSLGFFKKLRVIKGEKLDMNNASLVVLDNPNLSELFPESQQIEIQNGRLFFHYNPKLCLSKIEHLGRMVGISNFSDLEVQPESNGEKVACDVVNINITVKEMGSSFAHLAWDSYEPPEGQRLLGYLLNYIPTENRNISFEANACGNNTWQIVDVDTTTRPSVSKLITDLEPYTMYGVYVKTFTARNERSFAAPVGQSKIIFFRTDSDVPSVPTNVASFPVSDSEILVKWEPPEFPNGPIGYYMINGYIRPEDEEFLSARDYCKHGLISEPEDEGAQEVTTKATTMEARTNKSEPESCCSKESAPKTPAPKKFEIFCHENATIGYLSPGRKNYCYSGERGFLKEFPERIHNGTYYSFVFNASSRNGSYSLKRLRHYSLYTISVAACGYKRRNGTQMCSPVEYTSVRTKKRPNADTVRNPKVQVSNNSIVVFTWDPANEPNGLTVAYHVEYTNLDVKDAKKSTECLSETSFRQKRHAHYIKNLSPGKYGIRVRSVSLAGEGDFSKIIYFSVGLKSDNAILMVIVLVLTFTTLAVATVTVILILRRRRAKRTQERLIASVNPDYIETKYVIDSWEVAREDVEILEELGLGNFGMVYRGRLNGTEDVAIKTISEAANEREKNEFLNEASVMKNFSTFHIIKLLGVVSIGNPPFVIMELMENGDLKTYLRRIRDTHRVPDAARVLRMAAEIADGMAYLESKKYVHRDLAARNCMISKDLVCKIGDFGMARDIYETDYYKIGKKGLLPIRWMAPENLSDGVFTSDSDVWSYGVVLYEIVTLAEIPYQGLANEEVLNYVLRKGTLNIPRNCPENLHKIMEKCFKWRPCDRPTFMQIVAELEPFLGQDFCESSFYHSEEGVEVRNLGIKKVYHHAALIRFHWGNETARWVREFEDNVTLLDQTKAGTSRGRIFKNGFQYLGNVSNAEDIPLDR
ncbi:insulin-like receptor isoform X2 [Orussus abietinus]|uniref:insulin-like receptor isoform X2 n=1 Tax=Orussus abietinus TaxID=222816 RepID=UPI00062526E7|nr:insulin-like receptor isoform X2 [Orussus abietinus]